MSLTSWFLVSSRGTRHRLPREMIFVGRDDCELMLQSRSVDKQHAVINYEPNTDEHKVKDLGSLNGTFVNDVRIQEQDYVTLKTDDKLRFGYDILRKFYWAKRPRELHIPEEALKVRQHAVRDIAVLHRGTPLYGQPAWWGDGDTDDQHPGKHVIKEVKILKSLPQAVSNQEPSYFEIPTKDAPIAAKISELPPQDQEINASAAAVEPIHGHASFTIEFDPGASGKVLVKDRVAKVGPETRPRPKRAVGEDLSPLQTAMVAAEVKVADWLAQNELPLALKETVAEDDGESAKSDVPVHLRSLKGSKHEDGTQSDSENALGEQRRAAAMEERSWGLWGSAGIKESRANVPEGLFAEEDSPARRCKSSASKRQSGLVERRRGSAPHQHGGREECYGHRDEYSDRGTYTIELENGANEEEEARKLIDKVFGVDEQRVSRKGGIDQRERLSSQRSGSRDRGKPGRLETELMVGGPRWVSQWATLAASHIRTDPEGSGGDSHTMVTEDRGTQFSGSSHMASVHTERKRRTLPQLPGEELNLGRKTHGGCLTTDMGEKQDTEIQEKENQDEKLSRGNKQSVQGTRGVGSQSGSPSRSSPAKSQDSGGGKSSQSGVLSKVPPRPLTSGQKRMEEAKRRKKDEEKARESTGKPLLRQESFTVEKPSSSVPIELIPRIDAYTGTKTQSRDGGIDSVSIQKDSEAVAAFLESTVSDQGDPPSQSIEGSMSPESDVDTTSTVSQADGVTKVVQKRRILAGQQKERTVVCTSNKGPTGSREPLDRRGKNRTSGPQQPSHPSTSLDLTDDDINSNSLLSDSLPVSTQDSRSSNLRGQTVGASTKSSRAKMTQPSPSSAPNKASTVPKPRPTRTSLLRRARLGESSDTEPADMDRMSVASEASTASSTSRTGIARRGMSRIEALAQPRRPRVGSPSAQSDSEATVAKSRGLGGRSAAGDYALRQGLRGSNVTSLSGPRARANSASKLPDKTKGTSSYGHITPASGTRWRRVPVEYASTSEDEYGSNRHISKQGPTRPFPSTRVAQLGGSAPATPNPAGLTSLKQNSRDQDEYMRDWTAHSEEIARISQDLAKDLAMLAREIHDVAGEIDSVTSTLLTKQIFIYRNVQLKQSRIVAGEGQTVELRQRSSNDQSSRSIRRQTWNRDDVSLSLIIEHQLVVHLHRHFTYKSTYLKSVEKQLSVIDMMVDPDGTLDALSSMGLTSPLSDQRMSPGSQQGAPAFLYPLPPPRIPFGL
uniref:Centrosomal protein 170Ab n=1 Tax=Xiphophorus couchianus TaxID=32473 RepID=A0A3B5LZK0_9TELE